MLLIVHFQPPFVNYLASSDARPCLQHPSVLKKRRGLKHTQTLERCSAGSTLAVDRFRVTTFSKCLSPEISTPQLFKLREQSFAYEELTNVTPNGKQALAARMITLRSASSVRT